MEIDLPFSGGGCQGYPTNRDTLPDLCTSQSNTCTCYISRGPSLFCGRNTKPFRSLSSFPCLDFFPFLFFFGRKVHLLVPVFFFPAQHFCRETFQGEKGGQFSEQNRSIKGQVYSRERQLAGVTQKSAILEGVRQCLLWFESQRLPECLQKKKNNEKGFNPKNWTQNHWKDKTQEHKPA